MKPFRVVRRLTPLVAFSCALALAGCGSSDPNPAPAAGMAPAASDRVLSLADARPLAGVDAAELAVVPIEGSDGRKVGVRGLTPEGAALVSAGRDPYVEARTSKDQHTLQLLDPGAQARTIPTVRGRQPRAVLYADADERTLAWLESSSTASTSAPWTLLAYDRARRATTVVATSAEEPGRESSAAAPMLAGARVYWTAVDTVGDGEPLVHGYSRDLAAAEPIRRVVTDVREMAVDGDWMFWTTVEQLDSTTSRTTVHRRDLRTVADSVVATVDLGLYGRVFALASAGPEVAWIEKHGDLPDRRPGHRLVVRGTDGVTTVDGASFGGPLAFGPRLLGWTGYADDRATGGETWIFDRASKTLYTIAQSAGQGPVYASGPYFAWLDETTWHVENLT